MKPPPLLPSFFAECLPLKKEKKKFFCLSELLSWALLGLIRFYFCAESDESPLWMMTQTLKNRSHLQMNIRLMFDSCFKCETLIGFDFGQRMTHRDRCIIQARESVITTPSMSVFLTKYRPWSRRNVQESVLANVDISDAYAKILTVSENQMVITSKLFSSSQILHRAPNSTQDSGDSSVCWGHQIL